MASSVTLHLFFIDIRMVFNALEPVDMLIFKILKMVFGGVFINEAVVFTIKLTEIYTTNVCENVCEAII